MRITSSFENNDISNFWTFFQGIINNFLVSMVLPPLLDSSAVITILESASKILSLNEAEENPAKTTECIAPILTMANKVTMASGIIGK